MLPRTMNVTMVVGGMLVAAMPAMAGDFSFGFGYSQGHGGSGFGLNIEIGRPRPVLVQPVVTRPVVVQPVVVQPMVTERVWVPTTETAYRDVPVLDAWGRVISYRREAYTIESGYWTEVQRPATVVTGGCASGTMIAQPGGGGRPRLARPQPQPHRQPQRHGGTPSYHGRNPYRAEVNPRQTVKNQPQGMRREILNNRTLATHRR